MAIEQPTITPDTLGMGAPPEPPAPPMALPDLGMGPAPTAPAPPPMMGPAPGPDMKSVVARAIAAIIAMKMGPQRGGLGMLSGINQASAQQANEQERRQVQIQRQQQQQYQYQQQQFEQQARTYTAEAQRKQQLLTQNVTAFRQSVATLKNKAAYDQYVDAYASGLQGMGLRISPNWLRTAAPYIAPSATKSAQETLASFLKNPVNDAMLKAHPEQVEKVTVRFDRDGDGVPEDISLTDLADLAQQPFGRDQAGKVIVYPKGTTGDMKASADGILQSLMEQDQAEGKANTPARRMELQQIAIKRAKEAGDLPNDPKVPARDRFSVQPVTNADGTTSIVRVNLENGEASPINLPNGVAGAGRPTEGAGKTAEFLPRTEASDKNAQKYESKMLGMGAQLSVQLPNWLRSPEARLYRQAQDEFINAGLRDESGAAIQPSEYERYRKIYFMDVGDDAAAIAQKRDARQRVIAGLRLRAGNLGKSSAPAVATPPPATGLPSYQEYLNRRQGAPR